MKIIIFIIECSICQPADWMDGFPSDFFCGIYIPFFPLFSSTQSERSANWLPFNFLHATSCLLVVHLSYLFKFEYISEFIELSFFPFHIYSSNEALSCLMSVFIFFLSRFIWTPIFGRLQCRNRSDEQQIILITHFFFHPRSSFSALMCHDEISIFEKHKKI